MKHLKTQKEMNIINEEYPYSEGAHDNPKPRYYDNVEEFNKAKDKENHFHEQTKDGFMLPDEIKKIWKKNFPSGEFTILGYVDRIMAEDPGLGGGIYITKHDDIPYYTYVIDVVTDNAFNDYSKYHKFVVWSHKTNAIGKSRQL